MRKLPNSKPKLFYLTKSSENEDFNHFLRWFFKQPLKFCLLMLLLASAKLHVLQFSQMGKTFSPHKIYLFCLKNLLQQIFYFIRFRASLLIEKFTCQKAVAMVHLHRPCSKNLLKSKLYWNPILRFYLTCAVADGKPKSLSQRANHILGNVI